MNCPYEVDVGGTGASPKTEEHRGLKRGAGNLMPGVWGCPPNSNLPQDWGIKGVEK